MGEPGTRKEGEAGGGGTTWLPVLPAPARSHDGIGATPTRHLPGPLSLTPATLDV